MVHAHRSLASRGVGQGRLTAHLSTAVLCNDPEAHAAAVASKQRKLVENSAAIAAQPRLGATNSVPAAKQASKVVPAPRGIIASFFRHG